MVPKTLLDRIESSGQTEILPFLSKFDELTAEQQSELLADLESVEWEHLAELFKMTTTTPEDAKEILPPSSNLEDLQNPAVSAVLADQPKEKREAWYQLGLEAISKGEAALVIMGGGQGTRLGYDGPKGTYEIGALTGASLFELFVKRVIKLRQLCVSGGYAKSVAEVKVPLCVMTSSINHEATTTFFDEHCDFGYPQSDLYFFRQTMVPCFSNDGQVMMESSSTLAKNPNGNGGIFTSMKDKGVLSKLQARGVKYVHIHGIDNVLTKPLDPTFIGYCIAMGAEVGNKACTKVAASEKVGVFASCLNAEGKRIPTVVEYSELSAELADRKDESGRFMYGSGNICNHFFTLDFIQRLVDVRFLETNPASLHAAYKKIPFLNTSGELVKPDEPNGVKMEMFIFDSFWFAKKVYGLEVTREEEFAPVKNAAGNDSPQTARELMSNLHIKWLKDAGAVIDTKIKGMMEISPLVSYEGEGMEEYEGQSIVLGNAITK